MKVLVACEFSGIVRDAFLALGHDAISCDLLRSERPGPHYQGNVLNLLEEDFDLMIAHPPCDCLAVSGARYFAEKRADGRQQEAIDFFLRLAHAKFPRIAVENPVGIMSTLWKKPAQIVQPWQFGHGEQKATCLWLKNLPRLKPTELVLGRKERILSISSKGRKKARSRTYPGIALAMAEQWGGLQ